jgi:hypothetical protein
MYVLLVLLLITPPMQAWTGIIVDSLTTLGGTQVITPNTPNYTSFANYAGMPHQQNAVAVAFNSRFMCAYTTVLGIV